MQLASGYKVRLIQCSSGQKSRFEMHHAILPFLVHRHVLVIVHCNDDQWWVCGCVTLVYCQARNLTRHECWSIWWWNSVCGDRMGLGSLYEKFNDCMPKLKQTLEKSSIFSYACRDHSTVVFPAARVAIKDFLKIRGSDKVLLGTLQRRLQHDSIIGNMNWIPIEVGLPNRYTAHERIQNFLQQSGSRQLCPPRSVCICIHIHIRRRSIRVSHWRIRIQTSSFFPSFFMAVRNVRAHRRVRVLFQNFD